MTAGSLLTSSHFSDGLHNPTGFTEPSGEVALRDDALCCQARYSIMYHFIASHVTAIILFLNTSKDSTIPRDLMALLVI